MKRKLLILTIIMTLIASLFLSVYKVQAYSGEIDPENYITLPSTIWIQNKVGTGTVTLSSSASGYNIAYQKVDITKDKLDSIKAKSDEVNNYIETSNQTIREKESNLTTLQQTYQDLQQDTTATEEQIATARTNYETAYAEYTEYYNNAKTQVETLQAEYLALIPNYTSSWKTTTNTSNNIELDFSNYTGTAHFILWVKIDNGTNTYYDFMGYSSEIKEEPKTDTEDPGTDNLGTTTEGEWTDFSKAKFELKKDGISKAIVEISNVTPKENHTYYLFITSNSNKPSVNSTDDENRISLTYDKDSKTFKTSDTSKVAKYVELNQDLYATVLEKDGLTDNISSYGNKLVRFSESMYSDAFHATFMTYNADQIVTNFTHEGSNNRKIQIKIGKITDTNILKKIKNKDTTGFSSLMTYAKSNSGLYDQTLNADSDDSYAIEYNAGTGTSKGNDVINLKGLQNEEYYYLYIKTTDENGKYTSNEAVTLAQASVYDNGAWYMFFYGSSDFKWSEWGTDTVDDTVKPGILPKTGVGYAMFGGIVLVVALSGFIAYKKYRKYNF